MKTRPTSLINEWQLFVVFKDTFSFVIFCSIIFVTRENCSDIVSNVDICFESRNRHHKLADMSQYDPLDLTK